MKRRFPVIAAVLLLCAAAPAQAESELDRAERLAREGAESFLKALDHLIGSIPQYEMPEILPNGDIIIRRKPDEAEPPASPAPGTERPGGVVRIDA